MGPLRKNTLLNKLRSFTIHPLLAAFLIPFVGMLMVMLFGMYEPFGNDRSMLYSDMYHQYYPFFVNFRKNILSGNGILYNWDIGMGLDYLGLISYYLASPLNLLSLIIPESLTLEYFSLLMPIKLGLASLFFAIFLRKTFLQNDLSTALFGGLYGVCAWAVGYQWNIMWLDTFALLPLVITGTIALLRERKFILYTLTLFLSIISNYYIGFFTCIFVLLISIVYEICRFESIKKLLIDFCLMAVFSALAIGMTAILELPALAALQTTQSSVNQFPEKFALNIVERELYSGYDQAYMCYKAALESGSVSDILRYGWETFSIGSKAVLEGMRQVAGNMGGGVAPSFKEGLPNLYCGVGTVMLSILFLLNRHVKVRDKICSIFLLLFFILSILIRQLDYIWHGFHFTNMIPYRFSFLFSFVLLYMAYKAYALRDTFQLWQIIVSICSCLLIFFLSDNRQDLVYLAYNLVFLILFMTLLLSPHFQKKLPENADDDEVTKHAEGQVFGRRVRSMGLCVIIALEIIFNIINFGINFPYTSVTNYPKGISDTSAMVQYMKERENELFYRAEVTHAQTLNDGALNGYNGISTFTSSANVSVTEFMKSLGYGARNTYNRYCYEESSPVSNLFLGIKYMIERDGQVEKNPFFDKVHSSGNVYLLENNAYLPLGFLADPALETLNFQTTGDAFYFQNRLLKLASGIEGDVWTKLSGNLLDVEAFDATLINSGNSGYASYKTGAEPGTVVFSFTADRSGFACINLTNLTKRNSFCVSVNGRELYNETYSLPQMLAVSQVEVGDVIRIRFNCKADEQGSLSAIAAILDNDLFREAYDNLNRSTLQLTTFQSTYLSGTIQCHADGLLYTSIPQNGNWHAYVDGTEVPIKLIGDAMIAVDLTEGTHTVSFRYINKSFDLGWKITLGCAILFIAITIPVYYSKKQKGKYQK